MRVSLDLCEAGMTAGKVAPARFELPASALDHFHAWLREARAARLNRYAYAEAFEQLRRAQRNGPAAVDALLLRWTVVLRGHSPNRVPPGGRT